jgi:serine/threonine protein kinase/Tfp pilus assembly protein PilF
MDGAFGRMLIEQRVVSRANVEECSDIQMKLHQAGCSPLPRLGDLLMRKGYLVPGEPDLAPTRRMPAVDPAATSPPPLPAPDRPVPDAVRKALLDPEQRFGRYIRTSLLGQGGAGEVWKSWDTVLERWVALKFLKFEDNDELSRLKREAQTAARLSHPHIAAVFEIGEANGRTFLAMEYIDGQTLATYPRNDHRKLVSLVREVAQAIQYAHDQGVVHRDVKPGNIMVDTSGRPYILDFGLARHIDSDRTAGEYILGTPSYMSPEQARGGMVDSRSDVYSLGATLYELLSDRPPFKGNNALDTLDQVVRDEPKPLDRIAADLQTIVSKCLMKEPGRRYQRAADVAEDIRRWQEGEAIIAHPPSILYKLSKKIAKRRAVLTVGLGGLLLSSSVAIWAIRAESDRESREAEAQKLSLARPHLDEGRRARKRLDRLLMTEDAPAETIRSLTEKAQKEIDQALEYYPNYPDALLEKARFLEDRDQQLKYFTRAIEATTGYTAAYLSRAKILLDQLEDLRHLYRRSEPPEAADLAKRIRSDLKQVDAWSKDTEELLYSSAARTILEGDYEKAARIFEEYARSTVSTHRGWEWAGHAWLHVPGMHENAIRDFTEAIRFKPRLASAWDHRGQAWLLAPNGRGMAEADFRHALELDPANVDAYSGLGEVFLLAGDPTQAMSNFTRAVEADPGDLDALLARSQARLRTRDTEGARSDADEALRRGSRDPAVLVARGRARLSSGDIGGAQSDFEDALKTSPRFAPAIVGCGDVKRVRGTPDQAIAEYDQAIALDPNLAEAWHNRGNAERDRGQLERAMSDLTKAIALDGADPYLRLDRGVLYGNQGAWSQAQAEYHQGLALGPLRPDWFQQRLWHARTKAGEAAATEEFKAYLQSRPAGTPGRLAPKINDLLAGKISEEDFVGLLERTEYSRVAIAEGYFFAGEKALAEGRKDRAAELFRRCLKTGAVTSSGYSSAEVELRTLSK